MIIDTENLTNEARQYLRKNLLTKDGVFQQICKTRLRFSDFIITNEDIDNGNLEEILKTDAISNGTSWSTTNTIREIVKSLGCGAADDHAACDTNIDLFFKVYSAADVLYANSYERERQVESIKYELIYIMLGCSASSGYAIAKLYDKGYLDLSKATSLSSYNIAEIPDVLEKIIEANKATPQMNWKRCLLQNNRLTKEFKDSLISSDKSDAKDVRGMSFEGMDAIAIGSYIDSCIIKNKKIRNKNSAIIRAIKVGFGDTLSRKHYSFEFKENELNVLKNILQSYFNDTAFLKELIYAAFKDSTYTYGVRYRSRMRAISQLFNVMYNKDASEKYKVLAEVLPNTKVSNFNNSAYNDLFEIKDRIMGDFVEMYTKNDFEKAATLAPIILSLYSVSTLRSKLLAYLESSTNEDIDKAILFIFNNYNAEPFASKIEATDPNVDLNSSRTQLSNEIIFHPYIVTKTRVTVLPFNRSSHTDNVINYGYYAGISDYNLDQNIKSYILTYFKNMAAYIKTTDAEHAKLVLDLYVHDLVTVPNVTEEFITRISKPAEQSYWSSRTIEKSIVLDSCIKMFESMYDSFKDIADTFSLKTEEIEALLTTLDALAHQQLPIIKAIS